MRGRKATADQPEKPSSGRSQRSKRGQIEEDAEPEVAPMTSKRRRLKNNLPEKKVEEGNEKGNEAPNEPEAGSPGPPAPTEQVVQTPVKRKCGRPRKHPLPEPENGPATIPSQSTPKKSLKTPVKTKVANGADTPSRRNIADRSARRKSARALIDRVLEENTSDDEEGDERLVREIYESSESEEDEEQLEEVDSEDAAAEAAASTAATPSKSGRGGKRRGPGRPPRKRSPTPPRDLPPYELYFYQNRPGPAKSSNTTLSSLDLLTHEEYFSLLREHKDPHTADVEFLQWLHAQCFPQWMFELSGGFSICLYGYGSKKALLHRFAREIYAKIPDHQAERIVMVNGYVRNSSMREILSTIGSAVDPAYKAPSGGPVVMAQDLLALLSASEAVTSLTIVISSIDAPPLRRPGVQPVLSQLAAHPRVRLVCSADTPDFALLWDSGLRSAFNFVFHDCTTFAPPDATELDVVDDVHELLGRRARRVGGKDGVAFVLRSLPDNAKSLFRLLVGEVLVLIDEETGPGGGGGGGGGENPGVEYRILYNRAVEEFICSSEMAFRTLLKEFHDHQMITSRKDILGTELLSLPFRREELEAILEDLVS